MTAPMPDGEMSAESAALLIACRYIHKIGQVTPDDVRVAFSYLPEGQKRVVLKLAEGTRGYRRSDFTLKLFGAEGVNPTTSHTHRSIAR